MALRSNPLLIWIKRTVSEYLTAVNDNVYRKKSGVNGYKSSGIT